MGGKWLADFADFCLGIVSKPTSYGLQVALNKNKVVEIEKFIFDVMGFAF